MFVQPKLEVTNYLHMFFFVYGLITEVYTGMVIKYINMDFSCVHDCFVSLLCTWFSADMLFNSARVRLDPYFMN